MECKFSKCRNKDEGVVKLDSLKILNSESFRYLGLISHKDGEIEEYVNHRMRVGWMKWRNASRVLYDVECWIVKK